MTIEELKVVISAETKGLSDAMKSLQDQVSSISRTITNQTHKVSNLIHSSIKRTTNSFKSLASTAKKAISIVTLAVLGKQAISLASDLEEVQNVVDVAFGDMASQVEYFATHLASAFGLSELMAKRTASTYMAMATSMNIGKESAKTMSLQLTALTGDMASFYNVSQEVADTAVKSVFTGETESLKRFGIVMTEANLEAYRLAKGIKKSYREMSQAQKVAIRYNYIMEQTALAQGDFNRTSDSWANQLRLLKMRWDELASSMGVILTHVLLPIVKVLNLILAQINTVVKSFAAIFESEVDSKPVEQVNNQFEDASKNIDDATKSAEKYKRTIAGFDELNVLKAPPTETPLDEDLKLELETPYDFEGIVGNIEEVKASISDFIHKFSVGAYVISDLIKMLTEKFAEFGQKASSVLNDFISNADFIGVGEAIGNGINAIATTIKSFFDNLDFMDLGVKISLGISSAIHAIDWTNLGQTIASYLNSIWSFASGLVYSFDFETFGYAIAELINNAFDNFDLGYVISAISNFVNGIIDALAAIVAGTDFTKIVVDMLSAITITIGNIDWEQLGQTIHDFIVEVLQGIRISEEDGESLAGQVALAIKGAFKGLQLGDILSEAFETFHAVLENFWTELFDSEALGSVATKITEIGIVIGALAGPISALLELFVALNLSGVAEGFGKVAKAIGNGLGGALSKISGLFAAPTTALAVIDTNMQTFGTTTAKTSGIFGNMVKALTSKTTLIVAAIAAIVAIIIHLWNTNDEFRDAVTEVWENIKDIVKGVFEFFGELIEKLKPVFAQLLETGEQVIQAIGDVLAALIPVLTGLLEIILGPIVELIKTVAPIVLDLIEILGSALAPIIETVGNVITDVLGVIKNLLEFVVNVFTGQWSAAWDNVVGVLRNIGGIIADIIGGIIKVIGSVIDKIKELFSTANSTKDIQVNGNIQSNYSLNTASVPKLANGGVLYDATVVEAGEYPGAKHNPEIVAPQSVMKDTMEQAMLPMINAYVAIGNRMIKAIEDKDTDIYMDTTKVTRKISKEQKTQNKNKGLSLVLA